MVRKIPYFLREDLLSDSLLVEVLCFMTVSLWAFSVLLRAEERSPVDRCLDTLAGSALLLDCELEAGLELTVSDDLLLETVLCPTVEFVFALLLTFVVDRFTALLFSPEDEFVLLSVAVEVDLFALPSMIPVDRLVVPLFTPADCLLGAASEVDLLPVMFPVEMLDALSGCTLAYSASPSFLCSGRE
jgi:hypothetical protein